MFVLNALIEITLLIIVFLKIVEPEILLPETGEGDVMEEEEEEEEGEIDEVKMNDFTNFHPHQSLPS